MLKCCGKHVCRHICAKAVRSLLEPYSQYLISQGFSTRRHRCYVRVVEHFGRWGDGDRLAGLLFNNFSIKDCRLANVQE